MSLRPDDRPCTQLTAPAQLIPHAVICEQTAVPCYRSTAKPTTARPLPRAPAHPCQLQLAQPTQVILFLAKNYSRLLLDFVERTVNAEGISIISEQLKSVFLQSADKCAAAAALNLEATGQVDFSNGNTPGGKVIAYLNATLDVRVV